jgi:plasmid stability protein
MKSLHIRNIPEAILVRLKRRAATHRRSLQGEVLCLLEEAARQTPDEAEGEFSLHLVRTEGLRGWSRKDAYED